MRAALVVVVAAALAPVAVRIALALDPDVGASALSARGLLSDLACACAAAALALLVARVSRALAAGLLALLALAQYASYETVRVLGALPAVSDAVFLADPVFLRGSALAVHRPLLLAALVAGTVAVAWRGLRASRPRGALACLAGAGILLAGHALAPGDASRAAWQERNALHDAVATLLARDPGAAEGSFPDATAAVLDAAPGLRADLSGEPLAPVGARGANALLVVLESVSGAYVESLAAEHGRAPWLPMPALDAFVRAGLRYPTFLTHQRKTNRGLYSILCGDLPRLAEGVPRMSAYPAEGGRRCLPRILRDAGYETVYLQAAPLAFMMKDQFMPRAGFARVHGREWFSEGYARSAWGVDDRAFFERSLGLIEELRRGGAPWFLTLLTVGTHHPFVFPEEFRPDLPSRVQRSLAYLDTAFAEFARGLEALGVAEDTIVLVTSDESFGVRGPGVDPLDLLLSQNWGLLAVHLPGGARGVVREPFASMDLALSILDAVGLAERGPHLFGRSVFRSHARPRPLFFANTNVRLAGALEEDGGWLLCFDAFASCRRFAVPDGLVFGRERREVADADGALLRTLADRSRVEAATGGGGREFSLLADRVFVAEGPGARIIHGGQYVDLDPGEWIEVTLTVRAQGGPGRVHLRHVLKCAERPDLLASAVDLADGESFHFQYTYRVDRYTPGVQSLSHARAAEGARFELHFEEARMRILSSGEPPALGVRVHVRELRSGRPDRAPAEGAGRTSSASRVAGRTSRASRVAPQPASSAYASVSGTW